MGICPFTEDSELVPELKIDAAGRPIRSATTTIPGQPSILLEEQAVSEFLERELETRRLDDLYQQLWLVSGKHNVNPLHHQAIKGRQIIITERPDLHLIWYYDRIYIKPIPLCLMNYAFYETFVSSAALHAGSSKFDVLSAANGFIRTYTGLIVHESDFRIAKDLGLIPVDGLTWTAWSKFARAFRDIPDSDVCRRYEYGELRLTRLNFYSKLFLREWSYLETTNQYTSYFGRFVGPYLFLFGSISVVLGAMQVALSSNPDVSAGYKEAASGFASFSIWVTCLGLGLFPLLYIFFQLREVIHVLFHWLGFS